MSSSSGNSAPAVPGQPMLSPAQATGSSTTTDISQPLVFGSGTPGDTIRLYWGPFFLGLTTVDIGGTWSITVAHPFPVGTHNLTAYQLDANGNASTGSTPLALTITQATTTSSPSTTTPVAPGQPMLSPSEATSNSTTTSTTQPLIFGSGTPGDTIHLYDGSLLLGTGTVDAGGTWSITSAPVLSVGTYNLTAYQVDAHGNTSAASSTLALTITAASTPLIAPGQPMLSPSEATSNSTTTSTTQPHIFGSGTPGDTVRLYYGSLLLGSSTVDLGGTWGITTTQTLSVGTYNLTAYQVDANGNTSAASSTLALTITSTSAPPAPGQPMLAGSEATSNSTTTSTTQPLIFGSGIPGDTVRLYDGSLLLGSGTVDLGGTWSITSIPVLSVGTYNLTAYQLDANGDISPASSPLALTVTSTSAPPAPGQPMLAGSEATSNSTTTSTTQPLIFGSGTPGDTVRLYDGSLLLGSGTVDIGGTWSITSTQTLSVGSYNLTAYQVDANGDISPASAPLALTITSTSAPLVAPGQPMLAGSEATSNSTTTSTTQPLIFGSGIPGDTVRLYDGSLLLGSGTVDIGGTWSITSTPVLSVGTYNLTAYQVDANGDISPASAPLALTITGATTPSTPSSTPNPLENGQLYIATNGNDTIWVTTDDNTVIGGSGNDHLGGSGNSNIFEGGSGNNLINAQGDHDTVSGGLGSDTIWALNNGAYVSGGAGSNEIGLFGSNSTVAGAGSSTIYIGANDVVTDGSTVFSDTVIGFNQTQGDRIHLTTETAANALAHSTQVGFDTLVTLSNGSTILLKYVGEIDSTFFS